MFGYVPREDYEHERDARVRAEAREEALRAQVETLTGLLRDAQAAQTDLLDRYQPKPEARRVFTGEGEGPALLSSDDILRIPATGKRGMAQRQHLYAEALKREDEEQRKQGREAHRATLSPEEEAELELVIGKNGHA